jgi:hypothetical protein
MMMTYETAGTKEKKCLRRVQIFQSEEGKKTPPEVGVSLHLYQ